MCVFSSKGTKRNSLDSWLSSSATTNVENVIGPSVKEVANIGMGFHSPVVFISSPFPFMIDVLPFFSIESIIFFSIESIILIYCDY